MEKTVLKYAPAYWDKDAQGKERKEFLLDNRSEEYLQIAQEVEDAMIIKNIISCTSIKRNQNVHDYGHLLIREQLLAVSNSDRSYYRVRRFAIIKKIYLPEALQYNIDWRRCGLAGLHLRKQIYHVMHDDVILVVQAVTNDPHADVIVPNNNAEYVIDYIVEVSI